MTTTEKAQAGYVLGRTEEEYQRLRAQARTWEAVTSRVLDAVGLSPGASCLDAGCGPGETMRLMAQRVGPAGRVVGVDVDASLGAQAETMLHGAGHEQCSFVAHDLTCGAEVPGAPFDVVYARLLLLHVADPVAVLRHLWAAVAPGGHLLVHDYHLTSTDVQPPLPAMQEWDRVALGAFTLAGRDVRIGSRLPVLFEEAGVGAPDGTDVGGRLERLSGAAPMIAAVYRSVLPAAVSFGLTSTEDGRRWLSDFDLEVREGGHRTGLWPLLIAAWKRKPGGPA
jgi:SAM-dependent methyltransferase